MIQIVGETALQYIANVFKQFFFQWISLFMMGNSSQIRRKKNKDYKLVENSTIGEISKNTG